MSKEKSAKVSEHEANTTNVGILRRVVRSVFFARSYMIFALVALLATTLLWSYLGAKLQQGNADQLVDSYMFGNSATFHAAQFPSAHSFLIKWPIFLLVKMLGSTPNAFIAFTVGVVVLTIAALVAVIYKIERRPLVFGTICLALASVLLAIPAQPYAGALLPVNMAMIATRNFEYIAYIVALALCLSAGRIKSWKFLSGVGVLILLIASDKLFLTLAIGAAVIAYILYRATLKVGLVRVSLNWFIGSVVASALAIILLWILNVTHVTHLTNQGDAGGAYGIVHSVHDLVLAFVYAVLGVFTNFGANPAYDAMKLRDIPHQAYIHLASWSGVAFVVNLMILAVGIWAVVRLIRSSFAFPVDDRFATETRSKVAIMLIWSAAAAAAAFVFTNHYYAVDARYLMIALIAVFVTITVCVSRKETWRPGKTVLVGLVLVLAIASGIFASIHNYNDGKAALATVNDRDSLIAQALAHHPVKALVGDYWRVVPTKLASGNTLNIVPLGACGQVRDTLTSTAWQTDLRKQSFAYILSFDQNLTGYKNCTLDQIITSYGRPNSSTIIAGSLAQPKEILLFYDHGAFHSAPKTTLQTSPTSKDSSTILPITLNKLPNVSCGTDDTVMNVVAHQDDDLLFINPDLEHSIAAGECVRTVYMTAGDDGANKFYWLSREHGSEAAYSQLTPQTDDIWIDRQVSLSNHEYMTVASPKNNPKISLIFMHLPDGNIDGKGFSSSNNESLARLDAGRINTVHSVDGQSTYNASELEHSLTELMDAYNPTEVRTQANFVSHTYPDHSDHMTVGRFTSRAYSQYSNQAVSSLKFYIGYPTHAMAENVSGEDLALKQAAFLAYARFDGGVCQTELQCASSPTYGAYLRRQYQNSY